MNIEIDNDNEKEIELGGDDGVLAKKKDKQIDDLIEINTDLWDTQDRPYDENGETPFVVKRTADEKSLT
jgi:hypothetical protein